MDFSDTIKKLKTECENSLEYWTLRGRLNPTMAIFSLKNNHGWKDNNSNQQYDSSGLLPIRDELNELQRANLSVELDKQAEILRLPTNSTKP